MQIGVGHEQQCTLGAITQETLTKAGLRDPVNKNVAVRSPARDLLINQLRAAPGSLDAVIAYISNTAGLTDIEAYVRVTRKYNGCGILIGDMRAGTPPDAYFACDTSFMRQVSDLFLEPVEVSTNQLVIVVHTSQLLD